MKAENKEKSKKIEKIYLGSKGSRSFFFTLAIIFYVLAGLFLAIGLLDLILFDEGVVLVIVLGAVAFCVMLVGLYIYFVSRLAVGIDYTNKQIIYYILGVIPKKIHFDFIDKTVANVRIVYSRESKIHFYLYNDKIVKTAGCYGFSIKNREEETQSIVDKLNEIIKTHKE